MNKRENRLLKKKKLSRQVFLFLTLASEPDHLYYLACFILFISAFQMSKISQSPPSLTYTTSQKRVGPNFSSV